MDYIFIGIFGLLIGSFLNVCIYRIPKDISIIKPPSHCTKCEKRLKPIDLIPVISFIMFKGRCRYCKEKFSIRYMFVELITSVVFISLYIKYQYSIVEFILYSYLMAVLIVVFFIDIDEQIIPYRLVIAGLIGGIFMFIYNMFYEIPVYMDRQWWNPLLGILSGSGLLFVVAIIGALIYKGDAMGMGDVNIFLPIGLYLGWRFTLVTLFLSVFISAIFAVFFIVSKMKTRKDHIPFGPYIVTGTFLVLLFGNEILNVYLSIYN